MSIMSVLAPPQGPGAAQPDGRAHPCAVQPLGLRQARGRPRGADDWRPRPDRVCGQPRCNPRWRQCGVAHPLLMKWGFIPYRTHVHST